MPSAFKFIALFLDVYRQFAADALLQRDERLGGDDARNLLNPVVEQGHQVFVVVSVELDEHRVVAGGEVALHYLGNALEALHHVVIHAAPLQVDAHVGACGVAHALGVDLVAGAQYHALFHHLAHPLVNHGARHAAHLGHLAQRCAGILGDDVKDSQIQIVDFYTHNIAFCFLSVRN